MNIKVTEDRTVRYRIQLQSPLGGKISNREVSVTPVNQLLIDYGPSSPNQSR